MTKIHGMKRIIKKMKVTTLEVYNEELDKIEVITILGYCGYCKDVVLITDKYKIKKKKLYHEECWEQMHK